MAEPNITNTKILISESGELVRVSGFSLSSLTRAKISESNIQRKGGVAGIGKKQDVEQHNNVTQNCVLPSLRRNSKTYPCHIFNKKAEAEQNENM